MAASGKHEIYSKDSTVYIVKGDDKFETFRSAVELSGIVANLQARWGASGEPKDEYRIAIKPNIMTASIREEDSPVYTDPALVEELISIMRGEGFGKFSVVESQNVYDYSYEGRTVQAVADLAGYSGEGYEIANLTEDWDEFDYGDVLGVHKAGRAWLEADYRISFAKNKTHWQCFYTACIKNVYGCLPEWDKMKHYHGRGIEFFESAVLCADRIPVHFGFLDAWTSGDGFAGHVRDPEPNQTHSFFASENIYAIDWVAGEKMHLNPMRNYVIQEAVDRWGKINIERLGDTSPWYPWKNVRRHVPIGLNLFEEVYWASRIASRALAGEQDARFPPVEEGQWFFGITQLLARMFAKGTTVKVKAPKREG